MNFIDKMDDLQIVVERQAQQSIKLIELIENFVYIIMNTVTDSDSLYYE